MTTRVIYNKGMPRPIIVGRPNKRGDKWHAIITLQYDEGTDVIEFKTHDRCNAADLVPVLHTEVERIFEERGEPKHYRMEARTI